VAIYHQGAAGQIGTASQARKLHPYLHRMRPQLGSHHLVDMPGHVIGYLGAGRPSSSRGRGPEGSEADKERMVIRKRLQAGELTLDQAIGLDGEAARRMRISNYPAGTPWRGRGDIESAAAHCRDLQHEATWVDHTSAAGAVACRCRRYPSSGDFTWVPRPTIVMIRRGRLASLPPSHERALSGTTPPPA